jgi:hypothetical protein
MQGRAELRAVVRVDSGTVGNERHAYRLPWLNTELNFLTWQRKAVRPVLSSLDVGNVEGHLITLSDFDLIWLEVTPD